jgi:hypothetical protein
MIGRLAVRSLTAHPIRSAVLAAGFGVGVAVMAILLGVADVVLEQSVAPALSGGGDVVISVAPQVPARLVLSGTLQAEDLRSRVRTASPQDHTRLHLIRRGREPLEIQAHGEIPSLQRELGVAAALESTSWRDTPADEEWRHASPDAVLRSIDRFHVVPDAPEWASSWAEWLYFNGRAGDVRFYLTFLVGGRNGDGLRPAGVRLQLDRGNGMETFAAGTPLTEEEVMRAPDLTIGASSVRLEGLRYRIHLDLPGTHGSRLRGDLTLQAAPGRLIPPIEISGARGWRTGYVVPVMSGALDGALGIDGTRVDLAGGSGYHDHNWGFWEGVSWQWGQVQHEDLSIIYGRVFPPPHAADPDRLPLFVGVIGSDGPLGYANSLRSLQEDGETVTITETDNARGEPQSVTVTARSGLLDLRLTFEVESRVITEGTPGTGGQRGNLDFIQMRGRYTVSGRAAGRALDFSAPGSAETFRGAPPMR